MSLAYIEFSNATAKRGVPNDMAFPNENSVLSKTCHTLVLDDSEFDQRRIARLCEDTGLDIALTTISGLSELRATLDQQKFDLIIVDFRLMEGNGLDAIRRIRSHPAHIHTALLMMTAQADVTVAVEAMKNGCSDYLDKSAISANALRRAMMNAIEKSSLQSDLMRARGLQDKLARLVREFADESASEMKPLVLKMMRQARARLATPTRSKDKEFQDIDMNCRKLWAILEAMETNARRIG